MRRPPLGPRQAEDRLVAGNWRRVIDEVRRAPELLSYLQGVIDDDPAAHLFDGGRRVRNLRGHLSKM